MHQALEVQIGKERCEMRLEGSFVVIEHCDGRQARHKPISRGMAEVICKGGSGWSLLGAMRPSAAMRPFIECFLAVWLSAGDSLSAGESDGDSGTPKT